MFGESLDLDPVFFPWHPLDQRGPGVQLETALEIWTSDFDFSGCLESHWIWILCFFLGILWTSVDPEYSLRQPWKSGRLTLIFLDVWNSSSCLSLPTVMR